MSVVTFALGSTV